MKAKKIKRIKIHSYLDYAIATLLIASPWIFHMNLGTIESKIVITVGIGMLLTNFITKHKFGLTKILKISVHNKVDMFFGWFLIVSPFLYGFFSSVLLPHLFFGIVIFLNTFLIKSPIKIFSSRKLA